ncbi:MAG TPA: DUF1232 domain-containing protein [Polyangia bacterium]|jgi:uncharacterized membrane protein YkvA (DUF1232 family)
MAEGILRFREFVRALPTDVHEVLLLAEDAKAPKPARRYAVAALNYLLLNLDLVPDWVPVLGLCDDAAILRLAMAAVAEQDLPDLAVGRVAAIGRLANEADAVRELVGVELAGALERYVAELCDREVLGRKPDRILADERTFGAWRGEIEAMLKAQRPDLKPWQDPDKLTRDLLSYLQTKLGRR